MALDWLPIIPSGAEGEPGLGAAFQPYYGGSAFPVPSTWRPIAPDRIPRKPALLTAQHQFYAGNIRPITTLPTVPLAWQGYYPAQLARKAVSPLGIVTPPSFAVLTPVVPPPALAWKAVYPDWHPRRVPQQARGVDNFIATLRVAPFGSWQPSYPVSTRRTTLPTGAYQSFALVTPSPWLIPNHSWQGSYPAWIAAKVSLRTGSQWVFAQNLPPIKAAAPALGGLIPTYPDRVLPRTTLRAGSQQTFTLNLVPIPNAPAPTFSWQAIAPDRVLAAARAQPTPEYATPVSSAAQVAFPLAWTGLQTTRVRTVLVPIWVSTPTAPPALVTIGDTQGWRPSMPDWLATPPRRHLAPAIVTTPLPIAQPAASPTCVEISNDTLTYATMAEETLGVPTIVDDTLTLATLDDEGVC